MRRQITPLLIVLALITATIDSPIAGATTAQRTFVASGGVDSPTCSISSPCRSFAAAITATSAGGEVIVLDSAGYGAVTISQSVSIISPAGIYAGVSVFTGDGITVSGTNLFVLLRGLAVNGLGGNHGIVIQSAPGARVRIENCVVSKMSSSGILQQADAVVTVSDTIVRNNLGHGIAMVNGFGSITLERVESEGNSQAGIYISPNVASGTLDATISDSVFRRNSLDGIRIDAAASSRVFASVDRSTFAENNGAGVFIQGATSAVLRVAVQRSTLRRNTIAGIDARGDVSSSVVVNATDNVVHHNASWGISAGGSGATVRASGNSYDDIVCQNGGGLITYHTNSAGLVGACVTSAVLQ